MTEQLSSCCGKKDGHAIAFRRDKAARDGTWKFYKCSKCRRQCDVDKKNKSNV